MVALVQAATAGDPAAQTEIVRTYTRRITGYVRPIILQPDAIEDVTQAVFIKLFRRLPHLRDPTRFEPWLFTLARNAGLDFLRRRKCRPVTVELDLRAHQVPDLDNPGASAEIHAALDRALVRLKPLDRQLVTAVVAGERYADIAVRTGLSITAVKVRLHRVRRFLRASVGEMTATRARRQRPPA